MDSDTLLCNECGKCFKEEASLLVHYSKTHDKRSFTCGKCGDEIVGKQNHLNHMRKHKNAIPKLKKVLKCDICPSSVENDISENSNESQNDVNFNGNNDTAGPDLMDFDVTTADLDPLIGIDLKQAVILPINF